MSPWTLAQNSLLVKYNYAWEPFAPKRNGQTLSKFNQSSPRVFSTVLGSWVASETMSRFIFYEPLNAVAQFSNGRLPIGYVWEPFAPKRDSQTLSKGLVKLSLEWNRVRFLLTLFWKNHKVNKVIGDTFDLREINEWKHWPDETFDLEKLFFKKRSMLMKA